MRSIKSRTDYDVVVIDCPPQLGYLTMGALNAATAMLVTVHPQMVDVASMSQFLLMTSDLMTAIEEAGGRLEHGFIRYVITRHDPNDVPESQIVALLRSMFGPPSKPLSGNSRMKISSWRKGLKTLRARI